MDKMFCFVQPTKTSFHYLNVKGVYSFPPLFVAKNGAGEAVSNCLTFTLCFIECVFITFFNVGPLEEDIFYDPIYGLYFSHQHTYYNIQSFKCFYNF